MSAWVGSSSWVGSSPWVHADPTLSAGAATFTLTGNNAALNATNRMQALVGEFGLVGYETDFQATNRLRALAGDFNVEAASITLTSTPTLYAGAYDAAVSGKAINTTPSPLTRWFGPSATDCDCCPCVGCLPLFDEFSVTSMQLSGVRGPVALFNDPSTAPYTWEGFTPGITSLPESTCLGFIRDNFENFEGENIYTSPIPIGLYKKNLADSIGLWGGGRFSTRPELTASSWFACFGGNPWLNFGILVRYTVRGVSISTLINEAAFPDWIWDSVIVGVGIFPIVYRRARKTLSDGSQAEFTYGPNSQWGGENISANIGWTGYLTGLTTLPLRTVTMPTYPYDYLGAFSGTLTI